MEEAKGCPSCQETMPPNQIVPGPRGSVVLLRRCPDCKTVWLRHPLRERSAVGLLTADVVPALLRDFAAAVAACDKDGCRRILDGIATVHSPAAAQALGAFFTEIAASTAASLAIPAPGKRVR